MFFAWNSGEMRRCRSASVAGSPISSYSASLNDSHHGGMLSSVRTQFMTPKMLTPASNTSGSNASARSEEHTSELQSLMRISYAVFCLKKKKKKHHHTTKHIKNHKKKIIRRTDPI